MEESVTYQAILQEGHLIAARRILFRLGRKLFGPPDEATMATLNAIDDVARLDGLIDRILDVNSWQELLQPARRRRGNGRPRRDV